MNFIRIHTVPMAMSWGVLTAAVLSVVMWKLAGETFHWWMLVIAVVVSFVVDHLVYGRSTEEEVYITKR